MEDRHLFRAWDKNANNMHYYNEFKVFDMSLCFFTNTHIECEPEELILMQCTGLKDKNGKLIFEGDVLKQDEEECVEGAINVTYWSEEYGGWFVTCRPLEEPCEIYEILPLIEINELGYVDGNIHDNPKLLEKEETT